MRFCKSFFRLAPSRARIASNSLRAARTAVRMGVHRDSTSSSSSEVCRTPGARRIVSKLTSPPSFKSAASLRYSLAY